MTKRKILPSSNANLLQMQKKVHKPPSNAKKSAQKVLYYNEFREELPVTTEKKGTSLLISLLINKEDSSDEEIDKQ